MQPRFVIYTRETCIQVSSCTQERHVAKVCNIHKRGMQPRFVIYTRETCSQGLSYTQERHEAKVCHIRKGDLQPKFVIYTRNKDVWPYYFQYYQPCFCLSFDTFDHIQIFGLHPSKTNRRRLTSTLSKPTEIQSLKYKHFASKKSNNCEFGNNRIAIRNLEVSGKGHNPWDLIKVTKHAPKMDLIRRLSNGFKCLKLM